MTSCGSGGSGVIYHAPGVLFWMITVCCPETIYITEDHLEYGMSTFQTLTQMLFVLLFKFFHCRARQCSGSSQLTDHRDNTATL